MSVERHSHVSRQMPLGHTHGGFYLPSHDLSTTRGSTIRRKRRTSIRQLQLTTIPRLWIWTRPHVCRGSESKEEQNVPHLWDTDRFYPWSPGCWVITVISILMIFSGGRAKKGAKTRWSTHLTLLSLLAQGIRKRRKGQQPRPARALPTPARGVDGSGDPGDLLRDFPRAGGGGGRRAVKLN
nr:hypothetical protein CFP56_23930 [Quercus suber]